MQQTFVLNDAAKKRIVSSSTHFASPWQPEARPAAEILQLNKLLKGFAASHRFTYLDYYAAMVDEQMGLPLVYSDDGVHPNVAGYAMMRELAMVSIKSVVDKSRFRH